MSVTLYKPKASDVLALLEAALKVYQTIETVPHPDRAAIAGAAGALISAAAPVVANERPPEGS